MLKSNTVSHWWLGAKLESALQYIPRIMSTAIALLCVIMVSYWPYLQLIWNTTALALEKQYYSPSASGIKGITIWLYVLYIELYVYITRYHVWMKNCDVVTTAVVYHDDYYVAGDDMMTSSNGNIFRVTGHLCGEFTGPRWIPHTKASGAELWCLLWSTPE